MKAFRFWLSGWRSEGCLITKGGEDYLILFRHDGADTYTVEIRQIANGKYNLTGENLEVRGLGKSAQNKVIEWALSLGYVAA